MSGVARALGGIFKKPKRQEIAAPPSADRSVGGTNEIDNASRQSLNNQAQRRNIADDAERSLLGTSTKQEQRNELLGSLVQRNKDNLSEIEKKRLAKVKKLGEGTTLQQANTANLSRKFRNF